MKSLASIPHDTSLLFPLLDRLTRLPLFLLLPQEGFRFVYANQAMLQLCGHASQNLMALRHSLHPEFPLPGIDQLWQQMDDTLQAEIDIRISGNQACTLQITLHRLLHDDTPYLLGYLQDPQIQRDLIQARQAAEQALAVRNRFLTHMSHELRTPLNGILGLSHLARDTESLILARDYFQQIHRSGQHLQTVLADIFDFCQIETGAITLNPVSFSLKSLIDDIVQAVKSRALGKHLLLNIQIDPTLPAYLWGDVRRLRHIVYNLVDNAFKFTDQGEICISVSPAAPDPAHPLKVLFTVSDTGSGIQPTDRARLFNAFEQLDQAENRAHQGLGLGLALAAHLVRLMGGSGIEVDSTPGQGSRFSLALPFDPAMSSVTRQDSIRIATDRPLAGLSVLVVEDSLVNQRIICTLLEKAGAVTTVASNGLIAVNRLKESGTEAYDVILMDIQMPVMDGYEATRTIRESLNLRQIPIIAVTANALSSDRMACLQVGMNDHLTKPIDPQTLVGSILQNLPSQATVLLNEAGGGPSLKLMALRNTHRVFMEVIPNLPTALMNLGNDEKLYCELARLFITQQAGSLERIEQYLQQNDRPQALALIHTLTELSSALGLLPLHQALSELNFRLKSCPQVLIQPELERARTEMNTTIRALRQLLLGLPV